MRAISFLLLLAALGSSKAVANQATVYFDRSSFELAAPSLVTETFEGCAGAATQLGVNVSLSTANPGPCSSFTSGLNISPTTGRSLFITDGTNLINGSKAIGVNTTLEDIRISLIPGVRALGVDLFEPATSPGSARFVLELFDRSGMNLENFAYNTSRNSFIGFVSPVDIGYLMVRGSLNGAIYVDNISISIQSPVPEPKSWSMLLAGFALIGAGVRRRRHMSFVVVRSNELPSS